MKHQRLIGTAFFIVLCLLVLSCGNNNGNASVVEVDVQYSNSTNNTTTTSLANLPTSTTTTVAKGSTVTTSTTTAAMPTAEKMEDAKSGREIGFTEDQLGLEVLVDDHMDLFWGRSGIDTEHVSLYEAKLESNDPATKRRGEFEFELLLKLGENSFDDDTYGTQLRGHASDGYLMCFLTALGQKVTTENLYKLHLQTPEEQKAMFERLGWNDERTDQVAQNCWDEALEFRHLGDGQGERLLRLQREHYLEIARAWVAENPEKVVPLPK